jgi:hypothetical protein
LLCTTSHKSRYSPLIAIVIYISLCSVGIPFVLVGSMYKLWPGLPFSAYCLCQHCDLIFFDSTDNFYMSLMLFYPKFCTFLVRFDQFSVNYDTYDTKVAALGFFSIFCYVYTTNRWSAQVYCNSSPTLILDLLEKLYI